MRKDLHGLTLSTDSGTAVDAFDRATLAYLKYRTDAARHLGAALKAGDRVTVSGVLNYQACDDVVCFNPVSAPVSWSVTVK